MNDKNEVILLGTISSREKMCRYSKNGTPYTKFTLAIAKVNSLAVAYVPCQVWGKDAESIASFKDLEGRRMLVNGEIHSYSYKAKDGKDIFGTIVNVVSLQLSDEMAGRKASTTEERAYKANVEANTTTISNNAYEQSIADEDLPF